MSKELQLPVDDVLRHFRFNTLNTSVAAKEMNNLDKAMGDILARTDIPRERKLKMYYEALSQFRDARDTYNDNSRTIVSIQPEKTKPTVTESAGSSTENGNRNIDSTSVSANLISSPAANVLNESSSFRTPNEVNQISSSPVSPVKDTVSSSPAKKVAQNVRRNLAESFTSASPSNKKKLQEAYIKNVELKNDAVYIPSPSAGGKMKRIGTKDEVDQVFDYLMSTDPLKSSPKFGSTRPRRNIQLQNDIADFLMNKMSDLSGPNKQSRYPNLYQNLVGRKLFRPSVSFSSDSSTFAQRSASPPLRTKSRPSSIGQKGQKGGKKQGQNRSIIISPGFIHFSKWNTLNKKYHL